MTVQIIVGDALATVAKFDDRRFQSCVTSVPYWGLRDYGVDGQIGLERSATDYLDKLVAVFREVRRALRDDGTLWLNIGDSYTDGGRGGDSGSVKLTGGRRTQEESRKAGNRKGTRPFGLAAKQLLMMPARLAMALQADGWWLRSDNIWAKPNGMPSSVTDRTTSSHEHVFMLSKSRRYFFNQDAVRTPLAASSIARLEQPTLEQQEGSHRANGGAKTNGTMKAVKFGGNKRMGGSGGGCIERSTRERERERERESSAVTGHAQDANGNRPGAAFDGANLRDVWWIATEPNKEAHFAMMPKALAETCILAGSRVGDTVLDPFAGAGTTGLVADRRGRHAVLVELNPTSAEIARRRCREDSPLFASENHG